MQAGSFEAVHAIVPAAQIRFQLPFELLRKSLKLRKKIFDAIDEACKEETERWGMDTITYDVKHICDVNYRSSGCPCADRRALWRRQSILDARSRSLETVVP